MSLRNRFIKAATFEGLTPQHLVSNELIDFHTCFAAGGVALTTVAYCAVSAQGCGTPNEIIITPDCVEGFGRLAQAVHSQDSKLSVQIGHAGAVAAATGHRGRSPSPIFSPLAMRRTSPLAADEIRQVAQQFAVATKILRDSQVDAIEVHLGHGYLISEFLSPKLNRRKDEWGGTLENRARLARQVLDSVRNAAGGDMAVIGKLNMTDGVPDGFWIDESVKVATMFESDGSLDALELTAGSSLENPMFLFRGEPPIREMAAAFRQPMRAGLRLVGHRFLHNYPFEEAYLLPLARQFREVLTIPLILLGGITRMDTVTMAMNEGFEFVAIGRALLREPDLINKFERAESTSSLCIHCNKCMPTIYKGTHCVLVEQGQRPGVRLRMNRN
ncbi:MAG TPA: NADH:flavin oxidoreductase [Acidimicrobiales bacterium]|nr:NADH:flavin oxidoreductase [Acidimicrobiales bacterium]